MNPTLDFILADLPLAVLIYLMTHKASMPSNEVGLKLEEVKDVDKQVLVLDAADVIQRIKAVSVFRIRCLPETAIENKQWSK